MPGIGRREAKLTYSTKTGRVSIGEVSVAAVTHIARAFREVEAHDADEAEFYAAMAEACDELVQRTCGLDRHNVVVTADIPWMRRLAPHR